MTLFSIAEAQSNEVYDAVEPFIQAIETHIINPIITFLFVLAIVIFLIGLVEFLINLESDEGRKRGRTHMIWGVIGIFIMTTVFGILQLICTTIGC